MTQVMDSSLDEKTPWVYSFKDASGLSLTAFRNNNRLRHRCFFFCFNLNHPLFVIPYIYSRLFIDVSDGCFLLNLCFFLHTRIFVVHQRFFLCVLLSLTLDPHINHDPPSIIFIKTDSNELKLYICSGRYLCDNTAVSFLHKVVRKTGLKLEKWSMSRRHYVTVELV